jgi:hypothetical protein
VIDGRSGCAGKIVTTVKALEAVSEMIFEGDRNWGYPSLEISNWTVCDVPSRSGHDRNRERLNAGTSQWGKRYTWLGFSPQRTMHGNDALAVEVPCGMG